jgi:CubicO group peptidase (beta-lactamase class C family)
MPAEPRSARPPSADPPAAASRSLPSHPSLRYLKIEAKRRLAAGEFPALHDAQAAIAREHGLSGWAALKQTIGGRAWPESHALAQLSWVAARFRDARTPAWSPPADDELREHFAEPVLTAVPSAELVESIAGLAPYLREEPVVIDAAELTASVQVADLQVDAVSEAQPPHRLTELGVTPLVRHPADPRTASPPPLHSHGDVPAVAAQAAAWALAELGLPGMAIAGGAPGARGAPGAPDTAPWAVAAGWADLDRDDALDLGHEFAALGVAPLVTATAMLRLVAEGRAGLDDRAGDHLRSVRLADDTISIRELLSHTSGVSNPPELFADAVPSLAELAGPVIACDGQRGTLRPSNGGYAVLGQLITDITGTSYAEAVTRLVLRPLGMSASSFPSSVADLGPDCVTRYALRPDGVFDALPPKVCTMPAIGGLWATPADLVRLGTGWSGLLPAALADEALTPQADPGPGHHPGVGLGWLLSPDGELAIHAGAGPGAAASLLLRLRDRQVYVILANRLVGLDPVIDRLLGRAGEQAGGWAR